MRKQSHQEDVGEIEGGGSGASVVRSSGPSVVWVKSTPEREHMSKFSALRMSSCP